MAEANGEALCESNSIVLTNSGLGVMEALQDALETMENFATFLDTQREEMASSDAQGMSAKLTSELIRF